MVYAYALNWILQCYCYINCWMRYKLFWNIFDWIVLEQDGKTLKRIKMSSNRRNRKCRKGYHLEYSEIRRALELVPSEGGDGGFPEVYVLQGTGVEGWKSREWVVMEVNSPQLGVLTQTPPGKSLILWSRKVKLFYRHYGGKMCQLNIWCLNRLPNTTIQEKISFNSPTEQ